MIEAHVRDMWLQHDTSSSRKSNIGFTAAVPLVHQPNVSVIEDGNVGAACCSPPLFCPFCLCGCCRLVLMMMGTPYECASITLCATASATPTTPPRMTHPCTSLTGPTVTAAAARHYWGNTAYRTCSQRTSLGWWGSAGGHLIGRCRDKRCTIIDNIVGGSRPKCVAAWGSAELGACRTVDTTS